MAGFVYDFLLPKKVLSLLDKCSSQIACSLSINEQNYLQTHVSWLTKKPMNCMYLQFSREGKCSHEIQETTEHFRDSRGFLIGSKDLCPSNCEQDYSVGVRRVPRLCAGKLRVRKTKVMKSPRDGALKGRKQVMWILVDSLANKIYPASFGLQLCAVRPEFNVGVRGSRPRSVCTLLTQPSLQPCKKQFASVVTIFTWV